MSIAEPPAAGAGAEPDAPAPLVKRRPLRKRVMHAVRRAHLYFGLFLLPWAVLYGVTGFLFNHPTAFADAPSVTFGAGELAGTPMGTPAKPSEVAEQVVKALNERAPGDHKYELVEPEKAKYTRDFAFATVKTEGQEVSLLFDVNRPGGTVRSKAAAPPPKEVEKAPFAVTGGKAAGGNPKGGGMRAERGGAKGEPTHNHAATGLQLADPLHERVKASVPTVLERTGFPAGDVTVTSVPDLSFRMSDGAKVWAVTYNAQTGAVGGAPLEAAAPPEELSTRRFLTRLHLAHGFPGDTNAKWFWAVIVDAMAFVMVFWGVSGVFMWWQIKATRLLGFLVLLLSACAATALGFGMHDLLAPK